MDIGGIMTRATIWLALAGYALWFVTSLLARRNPGLRKTARASFTAGCLFFLAHVFCAFNFHYDWSHTTAFQRTAEQVGRTTGTESGWGIFVSYAFTLLWVIDVIWWWRAGLDSYERRPGWITAIWNLFFIFLIFNGTVIFETGYPRWIGLALCSLLVGFWIYSKTTRHPLKQHSSAS